MLSFTSLIIFHFKKQKYFLLYLCFYLPLSLLGELILTTKTRKDGKHLKSSWGVFICFLWQELATLVNINRLEGMIFLLVGSISFFLLLWFFLCFFQTFCIFSQWILHDVWILIPSIVWMMLWIVAHLQKLPQLYEEQMLDVTWKQWWWYWAYLNTFFLFFSLVFLYGFYLVVEQSSWVLIQLSPLYMALDASYLLYLTAISWIWVLFTRVQKQYHHHASRWWFIGVICIVSLVAWYMLFMQAQIGYLYQILLANITVLFFFFVWLLLADA